MSITIASSKLSAPNILQLEIYSFVTIVSSFVTFPWCFRLCYDINLLLINEISCLPHPLLTQHNLVVSKKILNIKLGNHIS